MTNQTAVRITRITTAQDYAYAASMMEACADRVVKSGDDERIWFLEHPHVYTLGRSAKRHDVIDTEQRVSIVETTRGGQVTYHGPGQRIVWLMLNISNHAAHIRAFVSLLQDWTQASLREIGIDSFRHPQHIGIWADNGQGGQVKLAAFGLRVRRGVSRFGFAVNVSTDLSYYDGIIPCGISEDNLGIGSLRSLGRHHDMATPSAPKLDARHPTTFDKTSHALPVTLVDLDRALLKTYPRFFQSGYVFDESQVLPSVS